MSRKTNAEKGNLRETFILNQISVKYNVNLPPKGYFYVEEKFLFEIGGKHKSPKQYYRKDSFIIRDDIK